MDNEISKTMQPGHLVWFTSKKVLDAMLSPLGQELISTLFKRNLTISVSKQSQERYQRDCS